ncbi:MAG: hypothetical protein PUK70_08765 [Bacteroidales bacterium]|nr:hypothetical protein [Bacteroidales bacterium]MDY6000991.1 hypothetical protein [Candidatus Cryptobacteroides sp.]
MGARVCAQQECLAYAMRIDEYDSLSRETELLTGWRQRVGEAESDG